MSIEVLPLGAGQDVGRSCCIVRMAGKTIVFDCGAHFGFKDARRFPEFSLLSRAGRFTDIVDALVITHFHTDHIGALPYFTEVCGYRGPILMTVPTFAIAPIMLGDYVKVNSDRPGERPPYTEQNVRECLRRVTAVELNQEVMVAPGLSFTFHYAGHVLGAAMVTARAGHLTAMYTGDFNSSPDRHLGPAEPLAPGAAGGGPASAPWRRPDVLISEATYAASLREPKRARERDLLGAVVETVTAGGKVLIPTFAMGRAQELLMLITDCWERNGLQVPIYFSSSMASRALVYYTLLLNWTNANVRRTVFGTGGGGESPRQSGRLGQRSGYYRCYDALVKGEGRRGVGELAADEKVAEEGLGRGRDASVHGQIGGEGGREGEGGDDYASEEEEEEEADDGKEDRGEPDWRQGRRGRRALPPDIPRHGARDGSGGDISNGLQQLSLQPPYPHPQPQQQPQQQRRAQGVGVFSEADVYGMFRTQPWDRSLLHAPGPALLFASPGNIASGVSLEAFRAWAGDPKNLVVLAGYQVRGTLGARLEALQSQGANKTSTAATIDLPGSSSTTTTGPTNRLQVRCGVKMLAFSAHADLRGLMDMVRRCRPGAVVLVHGQRDPMDFLRGRIQSVLGIECHAPPTGTPVYITPRREVPLGVRPQLVVAALCGASMRGAASAATALGAAGAEGAVRGSLQGGGGVRVGLVGDGEDQRAASGAFDRAAEVEAVAMKAAMAGGLQGGVVAQLQGPPQPLTALPLCGVLVAKLAATAQQDGPSAGDRSGGGGGLVGNAQQLTLTDAATATRVLLSAHNAVAAASAAAATTTTTLVRPYNITYGCKIAVRLPLSLLLLHGEAPATDVGVGLSSGGDTSDDVTFTDVGGDPDGEAVVAATANSRIQGDLTVAALRRANAVLCAAVGSYAASKRLRIEVRSGLLKYGTFRARVVLEPTAESARQEEHREAEEDVQMDGGLQGPGTVMKGESNDGHGRWEVASVPEGGAVAAGSGLVETESGREGERGGGRVRRNGGSGRDGAGTVAPRDKELDARWECEWAAADEAVAVRCLVALRTAFPPAD